MTKKTKGDSIWIVQNGNQKIEASFTNKHELVTYLKDLKEVYKNFYNDYWVVRCYNNNPVFDPEIFTVDSILGLLTL